MNIYHEQSRNVWKTWALMSTFLVVIVIMGWVISRIYDNPTMFFVAIIFSLFMNFFSYWYSDKIVLGMYRARQITHESDHDLWNVVENLSITAGLPMPKTYVIDDPAPNAFATGRNKEHASVAVTTGLLRILNKTELEGVISHELSHIGNRDILLSTIVVVLVGFVSLLAQMFLRGNMFRGGVNRDNKNGIFFIIGIALAILAPIAVTIIQLAISRKREYLADASGALLTRYPEGLASALEKIRDANLPLRNASEATAHLFIANPFGRAGRAVTNLLATHPPVDERIAILRGMKE